MADDHRSAPPPGLYATDFYVWSQAQAQAIRDAAARGELPPSLDWEHLAEEVGDLGKSELRGATSLTRRIIEHLYLLSVSTRPEPGNHWRHEIRTFRADLDLYMTQSIRNQIEAGLERLHAQAQELVKEKLAEEEPAARPLDATLRWSLAQILGEEDDPLG